MHHDQEFTTPDHRREFEGAGASAREVPDLPLDQEFVVVICARVSVLPEELVVEGSIQRDCDDCGVPIWIGPASQGLLERGHAPHFICHGCGFARRDPVSMN